MVRIISGSLDSGKTTRIKEYYNKNKVGDGIISIKVMVDKDVLGYDARRLSDNLQFRLMVHKKHYDNEYYLNKGMLDQDFIYRVGPYKVFRKAMKKVNKIYKEIMKSNTNPIYFDEVGKLELANQGFSKSIKKALKKDFDLVLAVREDYIEDVIKTFNIKEYKII